MLVVWRGRFGKVGNDRKKVRAAHITILSRTSLVCAKGPKRSDSGMYGRVYVRAADGFVQGIPGVLLEVGLREVTHEMVGQFEESQFSKHYLLHLVHCHSVDGCKVSQKSFQYSWVQPLQEWPHLHQKLSLFSFLPYNLEFRFH